MTDLQKLYQIARVEHELGHKGALNFISDETGLDSETVARALARAKREDERSKKGKKRG